MSRRHRYDFDAADSVEIERSMTKAEHDRRVAERGRPLTDGPIRSRGSIVTDSEIDE